MSFGWCATTGGAIGVSLTILFLGILAGVLVKKNIGLMIGLLGLIAGFFLGSFFFTFIASASGWEDAWGYYLICSIFAAMGCIVAWRHGVSMVMVATALVGSYLFMRSWTLFFPGNWPSEIQIVS